MKRLIFSALVMSAVTANAQVKNGMVGINTDEPRVTMHIEPGVSESKGLIIPRITAAQMKTMTSLAHFGADHHAIITYLKEQLPMADRTGKLVDVAEPGYYYYDNTTGVQKWKTFGGGAEQDLRAVGNNDHITKDAGIGENGTSAGTGYRNIGIGQKALLNGTSGSDNIAIGSHSLKSLTVGHRNVAIGSNTLENNTTGANNVGIGSAFYFPNGGTISSNTNVGIGMTVYSLGNGGSMSGMGQNIGMGNNIYTLQKVNAQFSGWGNTGIGQSIFNLQNGDLTGSANIGIGKGLFKLQSGNLIGDNNIGIGYNSYVVQTGDMSYNAEHNIALGTDVYNSGGLFTAGYSIGIGYEVFNAAGGISGKDNIAIGKKAMRANVGDISGFNNIAIGTEAMINSLGHIVGANNIAVGNNALRVSNGDTGKYNIAIGDWALGANDMGMGNGNIQIGNMNEAPPVTGRRNNVVAIGNKMGDINNSVPDNVILLGARSDTTNSPRVGVGIYQPRAKLDVAGEIRIGTEGNACTSVNEGAIRYVRTYKLFQGCDGTNWVDLN